MPVWKVFPELYEQMKALKDEALTEAEIDKLKQKAEKGSRPFQLPGEMFWISEANKTKALEIIKSIGGKDHTLDYDTLLLQSGTANASASSEAKSEAK